MDEPTDEAKERFLNATRGAEEISDTITELSMKHELHPFEIIGILTNYIHVINERMNTS